MTNNNQTNTVCDCDLSACLAGECEHTVKSPFARFVAACGAEHPVETEGYILGGVTLEWCDVGLRGIVAKVKSGVELSKLEWERYYTWLADAAEEIADEREREQADREAQESAWAAGK